MLLGGWYSKAKLLALAYDYEQATKLRLGLKLLSKKP